jgi:uncharacterized protein YbcI
MNLMCESSPTLAQQVARAAGAFQQQSTGHEPRSVTAVLNEDTLVVTLHDALTPAEKALAERPAGAAQLQEFHLQLFAGSCGSLRQEIEKITGVEVREATSHIETTTGTMVQVFLLADGVSPEIWNGIQVG